jgi:NAD(P)-dependent dehydrogenase (short-subunit alcohol dehydrogenase family)
LRIGRFVKVVTMYEYPPVSDLLKDRVILVTGAGSGIGRAVSRACAAHGATLVLLGPIQRELEEVYDEIEAAGAPTPALFVMDLEKADEVEFEGLAVTLGQEFQRLDGLLHNAAALPFLSRFDDFELQAWDQVMRVNLTAPYLLTRACLPLLRASGDASILFTSDGVGRRGKAYWNAYGVSKFGIEGMMQILADELENGSNIRVNSIDPGAVRSNLRAKVYPAVDPNSWPDPQSVVGVYLYLLGPDSRGVTGQAFSAQEAV